MFISVIIPTRNRSELLNDTLLSLSLLKFPNDCFEIIVVDNDSTDNTKQITDDFIRSQPNCIYLSEELVGLHNARHCGLKASKGEIVSFIDDDVIVMESWLTGVAMGFDMGEDVLIVGGNDHPRFEADTPAWVESLWKTNSYGRYLSEYSLIEAGDKMKEFSPHMIYGCNLSIRKKFVIDSGGFHPDGFPENLLKFRGDGESFLSDQVVKCNGRAMFVPEASLYHRVSENRLTIDYLRRRSYMQGVSYSYSLIRDFGYFSFRIRIQLRIKFIYGFFRSRLIRTEPFRSMAVSFYEGFAFHLKEVKSDSDLLQWVLIKTYLK